MKIGAFAGGMLLGTATGMAADMLLRPKARPTTDAGKAAQAVSNAMEDVADVVKKRMQ